MKSIICLILVVLTWGESVESFWSLMRAGQYEEAVVKIETYLTKGKKVTEAERAEGDILMQKAQVCMDMQQRAQKVEIIDSMKVTRDKMVSVCEMVMGGGKVKTRNDGGAEFVASRGNKRLMSVKGSTGFDIYRQYGDAEMERLSDVVNSTGNENFPFEMADGVTLYFSSEGHGSIGGYDLFMTRYNSETFDYSEPQNIGMPFNTLGNEYLMMADDITGHGLWATDWRQTGDTVMVYVYQLEGSEEKVAEKQNVVVEEVVEEMRFVVNDTLVYTKVENFRSPEAKARYQDLKEREKDLKLAEILLESMRMSMRNAESDEEKMSLRQDILDNENYVMTLKKDLKNITKEIRQLEIKQYE